MSDSTVDTPRVAVVGRADLIEIFDLAGFTLFPSTDGRVITEIAKDFPLILVTEPEYVQAQDIISKYAADAFPIILPIPNGIENMGLGNRKLAENFRKATRMIHPEE